MRVTGWRFVCARRRVLYIEEAEIIGVECLIIAALLETLLQDIERDKDYPDATHRCRPVIREQREQP